MSRLTHSSQVLNGPPRPLLPGGTMSMTERRSSERLTCPYHLRRRVRNSWAMSTKPSLVSRSAGEIAYIENAYIEKMKNNLNLSLFVSINCFSYFEKSKTDISKKNWSKGMFLKNYMRIMRKYRRFRQCSTFFINCIRYWFIFFHFKGHSYVKHILSKSVILSPPFNWHQILKYF